MFSTRESSLSRCARLMYCAPGAQVLRAFFRISMVVCGCSLLSAEVAGTPVAPTPGPIPDFQFRFGNDFGVSLIKTLMIFELRKRLLAAK